MLGRNFWLCLLLTFAPIEVAQPLAQTKNNTRPDLVRLQQPQAENSLTISTVAGNGAEGVSGDGGNATKAMLNMPRRLTIDPAGKELYLADTGNHRIRRIALTKASAR